MKWLQSGGQPRGANGRRAVFSLVEIGGRGGGWIVIEWWGDRVNRSICDQRNYCQIPWFGQGVDR
jgi:hypothetical protein